MSIGNGSFEHKYGQPALDSEIFQEILYRYSLTGKKDTAISLLRDIYTLNLEILPIGKEEIEKMIELATKYKDKNITPRDLIHVAVMITNNISKIISTDKDFDYIEEIKRIDPVDL